MKHRPSDRCASAKSLKKTSLYYIYLYIQYTRESLVPSWSTAGSANFDKKLQIQTKGTQRAFRSLLAPQDTWQLDELAQVTAAGHTSLFLWLLWVIVRFRGSPEASWRHQCRMCHHFSHAIVAEGDSEVNSLSPSYWHAHFFQGLGDSLAPSQLQWCLLADFVLLQVKRRTWG